jgi:hypothetical protein
MSRLSTPEQIVVRPTNNVYTALVAICIVVEIIGLIALYMKHSELFPGKGLFS